MASKQNECHLLGRKPYFQSIEQSLPFNLDRFQFGVFFFFFFKPIVLLFQGQGNDVMEKKMKRKDI